MTRKWIRFLSITGILLFAAIISIFAVKAEDELSADANYAKVKTAPSAEIGTEENPFFILEIVPNESMARAGYLIPGQEPIDMEAVAADKGFGTYQSIMMDQMIKEQGIAWSYMDYRYTFQEPGKEETATWPEEFGKWWKIDNKNQTESYTEFGYYEYAGEGQGAFSVAGTVNEIVIQGTEAVSDTEAGTDAINQSTETENKGTETENKSTETENKGIETENKGTETENKDLEGGNQGTEAVSVSLNAEGIVEPGADSTETSGMGTDGTETTEVTENAGIVDAADQNNGANEQKEPQSEISEGEEPKRNETVGYAAASETQFTYAGEGKGSHNWVTAGYYCYVSDGSGTFKREGTWPSYTYTPQESGNFKWVQVLDTTGLDTTEKNLGGKYWTNRSDEFYYRYKYHHIEHNDDLIQTVFEGKSTAEGFVSKVVTMTPEQMTGRNLEYIDEADMIMITAKTECVLLWDEVNKKGIQLSDEEKNKRETTFIYNELEGKSGIDFSWDLVMKIMERMASDSPAAMYLETPAMLPGNETTYNIGKLYMMLMQYSAKSFKETFLDDEVNFKVAGVQVNGSTVETGIYHNPIQDKTYDVKWTNETFLTELGIEAMHESQFNEGTNEFYNTIMTFNGDNGTLKNYLKPVIAQSQIRITDTDKFGNNTEVFDYYQEVNESGERPSKICTNQGIFYILRQSMKKEEYKKKLNILEIQPCNKFIYGTYGWKLYYQTIFPWFTGDLEKDLTVTPMTSYQFIGDIKDLNSEYDLIIMGSYQDESNGLGGYNDDRLWSGEWVGNPGVKVGRIYTSIGDLVLNPNYSPGGTPDHIHESAAKDAQARYSGNDITKKKYEEIKNFLVADKPVIVSKKFFDNYSVNKWVDSSSYVYKLISEVNDGTKSKPLFKEGYYYSTAGNNLLKKTLAKETCAIERIEYPSEYRIDTENKEGVSGVIKKEHYNETVDGNGNPLLRFQFTLHGTSGKNYAVKLYLDRNGDGIYANSIKENNELAAFGEEVNTTASEEVSGLWIYEIAENEDRKEVAWDKLEAEKTYEITRVVPPSERGILPWKLEVYQTDNWSIRCSEIGYTAIEAVGVEKVKINVLQMNLSQDMRENEDTFVNFADTSTGTGAKFAAYLGAVNDFNVNLSYLKNTDWYQQFGLNGETAAASGKTEGELKELMIQKWKTYLDDVDMLVIGFKDKATFTNDEVFYAGFMDFVNQGKSVILSHDLIKDPVSLGNYVTGYDSELRSISGQRRKYYINDDNIGGGNYYRYSKASLGGSTIQLFDLNQVSKSIVPTNIPESEQSGYTETEAGKSDGYYDDFGSEFMDNSTRLLQYFGKNQLIRDRKITEASDQALTWPVKTTWIKIANEGQITKYPYQIPDVIPVTQTHTQNYQLDLEQDDGGDVTVWYNLTDRYDKDVTEGGSNGGLYSSRPGDSRNSFYIYTKGNITYTGLGHTTTTLTDEEVQLFVNTMISAYRRIPERPYIKVTNEDVSLYQDVYTMYHILTGAEEEGGTLPVNFTPCDEDLTAGNQRVYTMRFLDAEGQVLMTQPVISDNKTGKTVGYTKSGYPVDKDGSYSFEVPYKEIKDNGEADYYLELTSVYMKGDKPIETRRTTKVVIYAMPLFNLN